jgi:membrane protein DedA with SNARE-associated domain
MVDQVVQVVIDWVAQVSPFKVYIAFTLIAYLENILPPIPGDILIVFSGYLAAEGLVSLIPIWTFTVSASVLGFMNMYWLGKKLEHQISTNTHEYFLLKFFKYKYIKIAKTWMQKYGQWVVVSNRFLAGTRSVISLTAGVSDLKIAQTTFSSFISSALWNAILIGSGWLVKENWAIIGNYLTAYGKLILLGISLLIISRILLSYFKKKKTSESN